MRLEDVFVLEFEIKASSYSIPNDPEQTTRSNGACLENVNVDPTERNLIRSWGPMDGAMKQPEGWKRNRGWGVGSPVKFHSMPVRFGLNLV